METFDHQCGHSPRPLLDAPDRGTSGEVGNVKFNYVFDLWKGFYQVLMKEADKPETAFMSIMGKFKFTRMPFWSKGEPATFQRLMTSDLMELTGM